jgi:hypothetical protein
MKIKDMGGAHERGKRLELPTCGVALPETTTPGELDHLLLRRALCIIDDVVEMNSYAISATAEMLPDDYVHALQLELSEILQRAMSIRESLAETPAGYVGGWRLRQLRSAAALSKPRERRMVNAEP